jgi:hypothetical protein
MVSDKPRTDTRIHEMKTEHNQALEPTPTAVTFCAYAQPAPAADVAHL